MFEKREKQATLLRYFVISGILTQENRNAENRTHKKVPDHGIFAENSF